MNAADMPPTEQTPADQTPASQIVSPVDRLAAGVVRLAPFGLGALALGLVPVSWPAAVAVGVAAVHALLARLALGGLPESLSLRDFKFDALPGAVVEKVRDLEDLGFERGGSLSAELGVVNVPLVPLFHPDQPCFAAVYGLPTGPAVDLVSELADGSVSLTTATAKDASNSPAPAGRWRQVIPGASVRQTWDLHLAALVWLADQGVPFDPPSPGEFNHALRRSVRDQRRAFLRRPFRHTAVILWRMVTGRSPFLRPLAEQPAARRAVARVASVLDRSAG
jgi:hypothetical protein